MRSQKCAKCYGWRRFVVALYRIEQYRLNLVNWIRSDWVILTSDQLPCISTTPQKIFLVRNLVCISNKQYFRCIASIIEFRVIYICHVAKDIFTSFIWNLFAFYPALSFLVFYWFITKWFHIVNRPALLYERTKVSYPINEPEKLRFYGNLLSFWMKKKMNQIQHWKSKTNPKY